MMASSKQYQSNAQRQAAYRARHLASKPPRDWELALLARNLHYMLAEAIEAGTTDLPADVVGLHAGETLRRLLHYLDPHPDPVRYEGRTKPGSS
jgi:hypothetical protein